MVGWLGNWLVGNMTMTTITLSTKNRNDHDVQTLEACGWGSGNAVVGADESRKWMKIVYIRERVSTLSSRRPEARPRHEYWLHLVCCVLYSMMG